VAGYNLANVFEAVAERFPEAPALFAPDARATSWAEFDDTANALAAALAAGEVEPGARIAIMLRNQPEYLTTCFAAFKLGLLPVNVNYRYTTDELRYLFETAGVAVVVAGAEFASTLSPIAHESPARRWIWVTTAGDTAAHLPGGSDRWADLVRDRPAAPVGRDRRSPADQLMLFTGGTTGLPKGVVWRQDALLRLMALSEGDLAGQARPTVESFVGDAVPGERLLPVAPFMHGTGLFTSISHLAKAGAVVCLPTRSFDAAAVLDAAEACAITSLTIVGSGQAAPLVDQLEQTGRLLPALRVIISSGAALSYRHKERLLAALPAVTIVETLGASEGTGTGTSIATVANIPATGRFVPGPDVILLDPDDRPLPLFGGEAGVLAVGGPLPDGYFHDDAATARIYRVIDGIRYAVPGDWAKGHGDGTIELLGRGSACINTGGEKVYPAEVEAALLTAPGLRQAAVVGVPDERLGESVCALVALDDPRVTDEELQQAVRATLAGYKVPRRILRVAELPRTTTGKPDYAAARARALELLGRQSTG
jgi:acyl-CoA synthetase (AMP-forming)/AMP-acid ligase II